MGTRQPILQGRKLIFYELNEVPFKVFDFFTERHPKSAIASILRRGTCFTTMAEDDGHLSPWITWPSLHRGVTNKQHGIADLGQDVADVDRDYPPLWHMLSSAGIKVGLFGSLHSYPLPENVSSYSFYVPDTFAAGPECYPDRYAAFQAFNLRMVDRSGRNVARGIDWASAARLLMAMPGLGLRARTLLDIAEQLAVERLKPWRVVRRRTLQAQIAFDLFLRVLDRGRPDYTCFFTNHVASAMHRYWPATFPEDYPSLSWPLEWRQRYGDEIHFAMIRANEQITALARFVSKHPDYVLMVGGSMGQKATATARTVDTQVLITDDAKFMSALGLEDRMWEKRRAMAPVYTYMIRDGGAQVLEESLKSLSISNRPVEMTSHPGGTISIMLEVNNELDDAIDVLYRGNRVELSDLGLANVRIQDKAGSTAYHMPEGALIIFDPANDGADGRPAISTVEIAPAVLRNYGLPAPPYMRPRTVL